MVSYKCIQNLFFSWTQRAVDEDAWSRLENEGILEDELISYMWKDLIRSEDDAEQMVWFNLFHSSYDYNGYKGVNTQHYIYFEILYYYNQAQ